MLLAAELTWLAIAFDGLLLAGLLVLSGTFSGSEAVLFSLSPVQVQRAALSSNPLRRLVATCMARPKRTLMTILLANIAINVLLFSVTYVLSARLAAQFGDWIPPVAGVASVILVVVFGEVLPKVLGAGAAERLAPIPATVITLVRYPLAPLAGLINMLMVVPVERIIFAERPDHHDQPHTVTADELKTLLQMNRRQGLLNPTEDMMLREVINLGYVRVRDVMVPRVEVIAYDVNKGAAGLRELMRTSRLKKVPVFDQHVDQIVGLIYAKVLFFNPEKPLRQLVSPVHFVPELITGEQLLHHFRNTRSQLAIAVDEFGGMAGLVTLEDLLESIVGEIYEPDEATEDPEILQLSDTEYEISGSLSMLYWAELFGDPAVPERVATVGGLVAARLRRPARIGDRVQLANVELRVTRLQHRRIVRLHVRLLSPEEAPAC